MYDFVGKMLNTKTTTEGYDIARRFEYDHAGRLLETWHRLNNEDSVLLAKNEYNELGQLVVKKLHSEDGSEFKQHVDHRYNIRGWLENINDPDAPGVNDLFSMKLNYHTPTQTGATAQHNGNISEITWKTSGYDQQAYGYGYDPMNRLLTADYHNLTRSDENGRYNEHIGAGPSRPAYDLNGNILNLVRSGKRNTVTGQGTIDDLSYDYIGNRLHVVNDAIADSVKDTGFKELVEKNFVSTNSSTWEYIYDANGNMIKDDNKGIDSIVYNHLNLPWKVYKRVAVQLCFQQPNPIY